MQRKPCTLGSKPSFCPENKQRFAPRHLFSSRTNRRATLWSYAQSGTPGNSCRSSMGLELRPLLTLHASSNRRHGPDWPWYPGGATRYPGSQRPHPSALQPLSHFGGVAASGGSRRPRTKNEYWRQVQSKRRQPRRSYHPGPDAVLLLLVSFEYDRRQCSAA
jgi:hypothetical protein